MALSDCIKCFDTPCTCGHDYQSWPLDKLAAHVDVVQSVLDERREAKREAKKPAVSEELQKRIDGLRERAVEVANHQEVRTEIAQIQMELGCDYFDLPTPILGLIDFMNGN